MKKVRILLADDHVLVRAGLRSLLEKAPKFSVIAEAGDGRAAIDLLEKHQPDLVLMDIAMPGLNGLEALARLRKFQKTRVIILSMHATAEYVAEAVRCGAAGYLVKDAAVTELKVAIETVMKGETYLSPGISREVLQSRLGGKSGSLDQLTSRQREVLRLLAEGNNTKEIAFLLKLSPKTVETHRDHIKSKLGIYDVAGLVRYAMRAGLIPAELSP